MTSRAFYIPAALALGALAVAGSPGCDANRKIGAANAGGGGTSTGGNGGEAGNLFGGSGGGGGTGPLKEEPACDGVDPDKDNDGDGWSGAQGDCNDCTPQMNPGAQDYPANNI